ncbi:hypothetical protein EKO04_007100 [Ascochyta lentis]|uniref:Uncharacterized protein n=1 Tax=Ascochyta lentis TaxID=205686 RepID=A0A8H7MCS0_9PLEO|nr:hypothetical protein EKO04_007100 [Ascochyta lentis]
MAPKECTLCHTQRHLLVRCQLDNSGVWNFVCPGKCWTSVSGGVEDARGFEARFPWYRYGGMWKDRHADGPVSAKKPRKVKARQKAVAGLREVEVEGEEARNRGSGSDSQEAGNSDGDVEFDRVGKKEGVTQVQDPRDASIAGESVLD